MSPTDSMFLTVEARQRPMHVGGLHLYRPPPDAGPDYVHDLYRQWTSVTEVAPLFRKRPARSLISMGQWGWEEDQQFDIEHHVRHNALPKPGRILELLALSSRLHSTLLDRNRPLWEAHLIEGLADGRFAIYFKIHHALVDGISAARLVGRVLSPSPEERNQPAPWAARPPTPQPVSEPELATEAGGAFETATSALRSALGIAGDAAGIPKVLARTVKRGLRDEPAPVSFSAPKTIFNVPITGSRRIAAQSWPLSRIRRVGKSGGATVNDVVLAMCAGALRAYLTELEALPDTSLIAMVPVALNARDLKREGGNAVGAVMCNLGTHLPDAGQRLAAVVRSMTDGKEALSSMTPLQILAMSALGTGPLLLQGIPGLQNLARPPFNLIISNVPGPRRPLYLNGARLDGMYPLSIPFDGQALNITCTSYASEMAFGLTGCRRTVPHLQRLLGHLDRALTDLELAVQAVA
ncbi:wax ester/triacylglycerol synthase family O-acyltransferase [Jatrophihabitans telluris]|uniref:Diacylglycerol O-acyltransferase n=2 Tax=Jatrophihabitans telluris TaxID=2038343 RepID=A0ABY4QZG7_9ACTN|nr:wax ester/triacylglycerol synthase family O-acyltransferase [Jatrophihabitans telluris]UQX88497.1 wax ester/triacylglycerol synthase family O-acyltransferase [Jatrophihabitans telluris]